MINPDYSSRTVLKNHTGFLHFRKMKFSYQIYLTVYFLYNIQRTNGVPSSGKITSELKNIIDEKQQSDILVTFDIPSYKTLSKISTKTATINTRAKKLKTIVDALENQASISQKSALELLQNEKSLKFRILWITNQLYIKAASATLIDKLTAINEVTKISENARIEIDPEIESDNNQKNAPPRSSNSKYGQLPYGLEIMKVPEVWEQGYSGQGVVVANIDTGVDITHDALRDSFVGTDNYGWFDTFEGRDVPFDYGGHGTHTLGTIVGHNGVGVAPGAKWMAAACNFTIQAILSTFQHFLCPGDKFGKNRNCSKAPRVISNSWGKLQSRYPEIHDGVMAFQNTGTFLLFAAGNGDPACDTCGNPAMFPGIFAVGATNYLNEVTSFSASGPSHVNASVIKPEVVAPGFNVLSTTLYNSYGESSGTSMATPHVSGVVALMLSKNPNLTNEEIWEILIKSTEPVVPADVKNQCERIPLDQYPNFRAGYGRINALKAINNVKMP